MARVKEFYADDIYEEAAMPLSEEDRRQMEDEINAEFDRLAYEADMQALLEDHGPWPTEEEVAAYEAECGVAYEAA